MFDDLSVLVVTFNRPESLKRCLESIYGLGFKNVFISIDGPRNEADHKSVEACRIAARSYSKKFENLSLHLNEINKGLKLNMLDSISWFFLENPKKIGVIIEDDVILNAQSSDFLSANLHKLQKGEVGHVALYCPFTTESQCTKTALKPIATKRSFVWGFATSKMAWSAFLELDGELEHYVNAKHFNYSFPLFWLIRLIELRSPRFSKSWAIRWDTFNRLKFQYSVCPSRSLVQNIGTNDPLATHMQYNNFRFFGITHWLENISLKSDFLFEGIRTLLCILRKGR